MVHIEFTKKKSYFFWTQINRKPFHLGIIRRQHYIALSQWKGLKNQLNLGVKSSINPYEPIKSEWNLCGWSVRSDCG